MIGEIFSTIGYFLALSVKTELLWIVFPLAVATIVMLFYQGKYKGECPGWNSYVSNSLVLLFVSVVLLKTIYGLDGNGVMNFATYGAKTLVSVLLLVFGFLLLVLNFEHYLPEKVARYISSPLTVNLFAYVVILFVYSDIQLDGLAGLSPAMGASSSYVVKIISLVLIFIVLLIVLNLIKIPIEKFFKKMQQMKDEERIENVKTEQKKIQVRKKEIKKEEKNLKKVTLSHVNKQKREARKLKGLVKKK